MNELRQGRPYSANGRSTDAHLRTWKRYAPLGLLTVGFGASLLGESIIMKGSGAKTWKWFAAGTASLACLNAGLCLFGEAVKHRALHDLKQDVGGPSSA